jgi:hypothetical protein
MIRRKKLKYNSDFMSRAMDEQLELLEERLTALYASTADEVNAKFMAYSESIKEANLEMLAKLEAGEITQAEYSLWVQKNILQTDLYTATVDSLTTMMVSADVAAMAMVNGELPFVVAQSFNFVQSLGFAAADKAGISVGTFQVYNAKSVEMLIKNNPELLPKASQKTIERLGGIVDIPLDKKWNKEKINQQIASSMIKGDSIPQVAENLQKVTDMDKNSAIRNARTAMTCAENMGRTASAEYLKEHDVPIEEVWSAIYDSRTRATHMMLDGTKRDENGVFGADFLSIPLRYPADPNGEPEEVYNCRCRLNIQLKGIDHSKDKELYEEFMKENDPKSYEALKERGII